MIMLNSKVDTKSAISLASASWLAALAGRYLRSFGFDSGHLGHGLARLLA